MSIFRQKTVQDIYDELLNEQQQYEDEMANLQREKDLKLQRIDRKYQAKIDALIRRIDASKLTLDSAMSYINNVSNGQMNMKKESR